ncbi:MAG: ankyrin repeat domain-containing protein [Candidatus Acidiferrales bacterium]
MVLRIAGPGAHASEFLVEAAANGDLRFAKYLVAHSAKVNTSIRDRSTPLSAAAIEDRTDIASYLNCAGTGVNHRGILNDTPLHDAAGAGHLDTVKVLGEHGADACALNNEGHSAAGLARRYFRADVNEYWNASFHCTEAPVGPCGDRSVSTCVRE